MSNTTEKTEITVNIRLNSGDIEGGLTAAEVRLAAQAIVEAAASFLTVLDDEEQNGTPGPHGNGLRIGMGYDKRDDANVTIRIAVDGYEDWED